MKLDGKCVCPKEVNDVLANLAVLANLNPDDGTSHGMRMGRCTDLVKMGMDYLIIKKWGRWASNIWESSYAKLDFTDLAELLHTPTVDLGYSLTRKTTAVAS